MSYKSILAFFFSVISSFSFASHEMQHGFILTNNDSFASHLVAKGHHSRQTNIEGTLQIKSNEERFNYDERKLRDSETHYFLFQAQHLNLPSLNEGDILNGHIVVSEIGSYNPNKMIVKNASFQVKKVLINIENPFFRHPSQIASEQKEIKNIYTFLQTKMTSSDRDNECNRRCERFRGSEFGQCHECCMRGGYWHARKTCE